MAVELARLALWVETLDRELPFEYLDHKLKAGNSLVGCWLHLVDDYPLRALEREGGDGARGERTKWLRAKLAQAKQEMPDVIRAMGGAMTLFDGLTLPAEDVVAACARALRRAPRLVAGVAGGRLPRAASRARSTVRLKERMDLWSALWYWPPLDESLPTPRTWAELDDDATETLADVVAERRFFHWEIEFPDVFGPERTGFDAVLGNPPWEVSKPNSKEFFSRHDPLYRSYGKTEALGAQRRLFDLIPGLEGRWMSYQAGFKSMSAIVKWLADPFDVSLGAGNSSLLAGWLTERASRPHLARRNHPYRLQGSADLNTYKMFLEVSHHVLCDGGRLGMLLPSGIYTDKGSTDLRRTFLEGCAWEWCYGFENRARTFPIDSRFKFATIVLERSGVTTSVRVAFMRIDVREWEQPDRHSVQLSVPRIRQFSPDTLSFVELRSDLDLKLLEKMYESSTLFGQWVSDHGGSPSREFDTSTDDRLLVPLARLLATGVLEPDAEIRDPRVRARLRVAGYLPVYEGKSFWHLDPYYKGRARNSMSKCIELSTLREALPDERWNAERLCVRKIARSTDRRTLVPVILPRAAHSDGAISVNGISSTQAAHAALVLGSLTLDYVLRMKMSANLNWFYLESLPFPTGENGQLIECVWSMNSIGADFPDPAEEPIVSPLARLSSRLRLDASVAAMFGLTPDEFDHIVGGFRSTIVRLLSLSAIRSSPPRSLGSCAQRDPMLRGSGPTS